jgi:V-type H+-transporting ATPase subunit a
MYKEVNPAVFTCVSFPFLFGVMFGDVGHGSLLLMAGAFLVLMNDRLKGGAMDVALQPRYILLLMGVFAVFNGFVYNEFFALPMEAPGGSCFETYSVERPAYFEKPRRIVECKDNTIQGFCIYPPKYDGCVYPMGLDPRWAQAANDLTFVNNLKMKLSVIIGIGHMSLGIFMKAFNAIHFRQPIDFFFEFLPQILLLWAFFGWMDFLIIAKWVTDWSNDPHVAPGIITTMINMFLKGGAHPDD